MCIQELCHHQIFTLTFGAQSCMHASPLSLAMDVLAAADPKANMHAPSPFLRFSDFLLAASDIGLFKQGPKPTPRLIVKLLLAKNCSSCNSAYVIFARSKFQRNDKNLDEKNQRLP